MVAARVRADRVLADGLHDRAYTHTAATRAWTWITSQPVEVKRADDDVVFQRYSATL